MTTKKDAAIAHDIRELTVGLYRRMHKLVGNREQLSVAEQNTLYQLTQKAELLPSELCSIQNISSQYLSQVLNHLEELEFISRNQSATDKRKTLVSLTKKGQAKILESTKDREEWLAELVNKKFSEDEKEIVKKALVLLNALTVE